MATLIWLEIEEEMRVMGHNNEDGCLQKKMAMKSRPELANEGRVNIHHLHGLGRLI